MMNKFIKNQKQTILVLDAANLYQRCLHVVPYDPTDTSFVAYKSLFLSSLKRTIMQFSPDRVIMCKEGFRNWRKDYYPEYKANRVEARAASAINYDVFFKINDEFINDFEQIAKNFQFLQVEHCEADDLIATIVKSQPDSTVIVQSSDRDFYQLFKYPNYKQWDGQKRKYIEIANPDSYLTEKIILGDAGDNVPRISGLKYRQGPKFIEKNILPDIEKWLTETNMQSEWERNYTLISFDAIPENLTTEIVDKVNSWQRADFDKRGLYNFMIKHKLANIIDFIGDYSNAFSKF